MSMKDEEYTEIIDLYLKHIKSYMTEAGGLFPHITVFGDQIAKNEGDKELPKAIIHIPIPSEYMKSDEDKDIFLEEMIPAVFKTVKEKFIPYGIGWASEAWMRIADAETFDPKRDDYKDIPIKKEILFISVESEFTNQTFVYDINRIGQQVNAEGDLVDSIELVEIPEMKDVHTTQGRFSGLYKKLKDTNV